MKIAEIISEITKEREKPTDFFFENETLNVLLKEAEEIQISEDGTLEIVKGGNTIGIVIKGMIPSREEGRNCYAKVVYANTYKCIEIPTNRKTVIRL